MPKTNLLVCITCKIKGSIEELTMTSGNQLYEKLKLQNISNSLNIVPVKCLAVCRNGCAIALSTADKWSYIYGEMDPNLDTSEILLGATAYNDSLDGKVPWRERPAIFQKRARGRIPPIMLKETPDE